MKKSLKIFLIILIVLVLTGIYCYSRDNIRFKINYEYINYYQYDGGKTIKVDIPLNNRIKYLNSKQLLKFLDSGTGILYFGYNTCPWCRNSIPILIDAVIDNQVDTIYYIDTHSVNLEKIKDELIEKLGDFLAVDNDGNKRFAVPDVYAIKNGKILGNHLGTVDSYKNPYSGMSKEEKQELKDIYTNLIKEIK